MGCKVYEIVGHPGNLSVRCCENTAGLSFSSTGSTVSIADCHLVALLSSLPVSKIRRSSKRSLSTSINGRSQLLPILPGLRPRHLLSTNSDLPQADRMDAVPPGSPPKPRLCSINRISIQPLLCICGQTKRRFVHTLNAKLNAE